MNLVSATLVQSNGDIFHCILSKALGKHFTLLNTIQKWIQTYLQSISVKDNKILLSLLLAKSRFCSKTQYSVMSQD